MKTLSIVNEKGGVGKTTTAVNMAGKFADMGLRVLLVDMDVQGHDGKHLGTGKGNGLYRWLKKDQPERLCDVVVQARQGLDLVQSNKETEKLKLDLTFMIARELYMARRLAEEADGEYDLVILDMAPGSDVIHVGGLAAADYFLIPCPMEYLNLDGVVEVINLVRSLSLFPTIDPPKLAGVLPTKYERRPNDVGENMTRLSEVVPVGQILPPIPKDVRIPEAAARGMTIWEYAPRTSAAVGYGVDQKRGTNSLGNLGGYLHLVEIINRLLF